MFFGQLIPHPVSDKETRALVLLGVLVEPVLKGGSRNRVALLGEPARRSTGVLLEEGHGMGSSSSIGRANRLGATGRDYQQQDRPLLDSNVRAPRV
jgi:hypothetical protein